MTATHVDHWAEGYRAALDGATYQDNPHEGKQGATAWAFGCGEGMRARNSWAFRPISNSIKES